MEPPADIETAKRLRDAYGDRAEAMALFLLQDATKAQNAKDAARWQRILWEIQQLNAADPGRVVH